MQEAAIKSCVELVTQLLLNSYLKPKMATQANRPLHLAAINGHLEIGILFLNWFFTPNSINGINDMPLGFAASQGHIVII